MKISVITVCYNSEKTIIDTLESVISQTYENVEYIVIDGGSNDGTLNILQNYKNQISVLVCEPDNGLYHAMNKGISLASGDIIGFINSDDVYANKYVLSKIANTFKEFSPDACYGDLVYVSRYNLSKIIRYWKSSSYTHGSCRSGWMPPHPTLYVRSKILKHIGGFELQYPLQADFVLCLKLFEVERIESIYLPEVLVKMRMGGVTNKSIKNIISQNIEAYRACKSYFPDTSAFFIFKKIYSRTGQFFKKPDGQLT